MKGSPIFSYICFCISALFVVLGCSEYQHPDLDSLQLGQVPDRNLQALLATDSMIGSLTLTDGVKYQLDSLLTWADLLHTSDPQAALVYANEAYTLATKKGFRFSQAVSMYYRALMKTKGQIMSEGIEDALADARISEGLFLPSDPEVWLIRVHGILGELYFRQRRNRENRLSLIDSSYYYSSLALERTEKADLPPEEIAYLQGQLYQDLGLCTKDKDSAQAVAYFGKAIQSAKKSKNLALQTSTWLALAVLYLEAGKENLSLADSALQEAETAALLSGDSLSMFRVFQRMAGLRNKQYVATFNPVFWEESMTYLDQCMAMKAVGENNYFTLGMIGYNYHEKFYAMHAPDFVTYSTEGDSAIKYYQLATTEANREGVLNYMENMVLNLEDVCRNKKKVTGEDCSDLLNGSNLVYFVNKNYKDLVNTSRTQQQESDRRLRLFKEEQQAAQNERRILITRMWNISGLVFALLIFLLILQTQQKKRLQARMEALRAQINPHFISNSLNAIDNLVNMNKREAASKYLIHFSRLTRKILNSSRGTMTSLADELQILKHFMALEQLRFRDKLAYELDIAADLDPEQIEVPALILQPYVENAIIHGIKPKSEGGTIKLMIKRKKNKLVCTIEDDGIGREKAAEIKMRSAFRQQRTSHGMKINQERLKIIGKSKGAKIHIEDLYDQEGQAVGTRVRILLPFSYKKSKPIPEFTFPTS